MKHKWMIAILAGAFILAIALGIGIRVAVTKPAFSENPDFIETAPASSAQNTDPNAPLYTLSAPETDPPITSIEPIETELPQSAPMPAPETDPSASQVPDFVETSDLESEAEPEEEPGDGTVTICIGGDTSIDGEFADFARLKSPDYPWEEIADVMSGADLAIVNLETCVSDGGESEKREGYGFETPPDMLEGFVNAGIDAVNLANNHTRDFGYEALLDTFSNLKSSGIAYFGAGRNYDEAMGLYLSERDGVKIGIVGANKVYLSPECAAGEEHAGVNQIGEIGSDSANAFIERLYEYDTMCDVLIVFLHAGTEETFEVTDYQKEMSKLFIDAGADIVVGGHSHTLQPVEIYNGKPIIYSIGNLIFWHVDDDVDGLAAVFEITADKSGFIGLKLHPLFIKNYKVYYLKDGEGDYPLRYRQIIDLMNEISEPYGTGYDDEGRMIILNHDRLSAEPETENGE